MSFTEVESPVARVTLMGFVMPLSEVRLISTCLRSLNAAAATC